jgi:hypothetical protein
MRDENGDDRGTWEKIEREKPGAGPFLKMVDE